MTKFKTFSCGTCGGRVTLKKGPGRSYEYRRGLTLPVPDAFEIPTCAECGEEYFTVERGEKLDALLKPVFAAWQKSHCGEVVARIQRRHGATLKEIERACGVTPTYLSHILAGRKEASDTLVFLLEAYAMAPAEFIRRRDGIAWEDAIPRLATEFGSMVMPVAGSIRGISGEPLRIVGGTYSGWTFSGGSAANDITEAA